MPYTAFIECERDKCNSRVQVPKPGYLPPGWVVLNWQKVNLLPDKDNQEARQLVASVFCSWKCLMHFVKGFLTETVH